MTYNELVSAHAAKIEASRERRKAIESHISSLKKKIEWNKKQLDKEWSRVPSWVDDIVFPFLEEVNKLLPDLVITGEKITFGMNCETPVHATKNGKTVFFSYLEPWGKDHGLMYHTQKVLREHPYGNDYETLPVESVEQYANYIKECITNNK